MDNKYNAGQKVKFFFGKEVSSGTRVIQVGTVRDCNNWEYEDSYTGELYKDIMYRVVFSIPGYDNLEINILETEILGLA